MIAAIVSFVVGVVAGAISTYFFLRNNAKKAAVINSAVKTVGSAASQVGSTLSNIGK